MNAGGRSKGAHETGRITPAMEAWIERMLDDRVRQGLPRLINDPVVLAQIAAILRSHLEEQAARSQWNFGKWK